jgi:hypothetical protein
VFEVHLENSTSAHGSSLSLSPFRKLGFSKSIEQYGQTGPRQHTDKQTMADGCWVIQHDTNPLEVYIKAKLFAYRDSE